MNAVEQGTTVTLFLISLFARVVAHGRYEGQAHNMKQPTGFSDPNVIGDEQHLKEHMQGEINTDKSMTPEEMEFHYFRLHDVNNDSMLDGLEILKALNHMMPPPDFQPNEINGKTAAEVEDMRKQRTKEMLVNYVEMVDTVLQSEDRDKDGYLTYPEYSLARRRDAQQIKEVQEKMLRDAEAAKNEMLNKQKQPYHSGL